MKSHLFIGSIIIIIIESCGLLGHTSRTKNNQDNNRELSEKEIVFSKPEESLKHFCNNGWLLTNIHYVYSDGSKGNNILNEIKGEKADFVISGNAGEQQAHIYTNKPYYSLCQNAGMIYPNKNLIRFSFYGTNVCEPFTQFRSLNVTKFSDTKMFCNGPLLLKDKCHNASHCEYIFNKLTTEEFNKWKAKVSNNLLQKNNFERSDFTTVLTNSVWQLTQIHDIYKDQLGNDSIGHDILSAQIGGGKPFFHCKEDSIFISTTGFNQTFTDIGTFEYIHSERLLHLKGCNINGHTSFQVLYVSKELLRMKGTVYSKVHSPKATSSLYIFRLTGKD